jgi:predicted RND superfamily exporter protein
VLAAAFLPFLQQLGLITGLSIIYAFLASVLVLPSLLVVWTSFVQPAEAPSPVPPAAAGEES